jgi:hypothetical protein
MPRSRGKSFGAARKGLPLLGWLAVLVATVPGCSPDPHDNPSPVALTSVDLLRGDSRSAPVRAGDEIKHGIETPSDGPLLLGPVDAAPGSELRFGYAVLDAAPGARARVSVRAADNEGEVREAVLFDEPIERSAGADSTTWHAASAVLPEGFSGPLLFEAVGLSAEDGPAPRVAWADVVLLPPRASLPHDAMNVVLVTLDTLRADHMSIYGYERDTTPFLRELARDARVMREAYTPSTWTLPSHGSLFTGLYPSQHGAITVDERLGGKPLPAARQTLAEALDAHGYLTMGIVAGPMLERTFGLDQGFAYYSDRWVGERRRASQLNDLAIRMLDRSDGRPFFLFLNYFDAHTPYDPEGYPQDDVALFAEHGIDPATFHWRFLRRNGLSELPEEVVQAMIDRYDAEISVVDQALRELFDALEARGLLDRTLVCITGDHGESFGENGVWGHGGPFYQAQARVPLVYRNPEDPARASADVDADERPLSIVELPSRILEDLALSRLPAAGDGDGSTPPPLYGERFSREGSTRMLRVDQDKYMVRLSLRDGQVLRSEQLFDVVDDPTEQRDRAARDAARLAELRGSFQDLITRKGLAPENKVAGVSAEDGPLSDQEAVLEQQLKALGYVE